MRMCHPCGSQTRSESVGDPEIPNNIKSGDPQRHKIWSPQRHYIRRSPTTYDMQNNKELITPIKRSVFIIEGFFISLVRLCPPQSGPFDGCGHLVGSTIINRWFYAGELQVLCILHPYAVTTRIEFSNRSQVYDVALFQHLCHSIFSISSLAMLRNIFDLYANFQGYFFLLPRKKFSRPRRIIKRRRPNP